MHQKHNKQHETMQYLKSLLIELNSIIKNKNIFFLDLSIHSNFGDILITLGALDFFKKNNYVLKGYSTYFNWHEKSIGNDDVIIFSGGGNFGDIHSVHQLHREKIIQQFAKNQIVILPQTIFFNDHFTYKNTCDILKKHHDLHICVRDKKSYELVLNMTHNVYLIPDIAHQLYPIDNSLSDAGKKIKTVQIKRQDQESDDLDIELPVDLIFDWGKILGYRRIPIFLLRQIQKLFKIFHLNAYTSNFTTKLLIKYNHYLFSVIIRIFDNFETIYSSRLHGFILANLLQKQAFLIDNNYGKNKKYFDTWFK